MNILHRRLHFRSSTWWLAGGISAANCIAAYQPKGAASLASSYINLANPGTYNAAPGDAPSFDAAAGWSTNADKWLTSEVVPATGWSIIVRFNQSVTGTVQNTVAGTSDAAGTSAAFALISRRAASGDDHFYSYGNKILITGERLSGPHVMGLAANHCYLDGVSDGDMDETTLSTDRPIYLMARNSGGTATTIMAGSMQAAAIYNTTLTAEQISALTTAMNAL
jgi:hypothetical protein